MDKEQGPTPDDYRDARGPEWRAIFDTLRDYRLSNMTYEGTSDEFYPLVDLMSNEGQGVDTGEMQMVELADEISLAVKTARHEQAEVVGWTGSGSLKAVSEGNEGYIWPSKADAHPIPLFASPPSVAKGGGTDNMVAETLRKLLAEVRGMEAREAEFRTLMGNTNWSILILRADDATAALDVGDEGREGWQPIHTAKKDRTIILGAWPLDRAGKLWVRLPVFWDGDAWVAPWDVSGPHPVELWCDLPSLPTPPSRGEGE